MDEEHEEGNPGISKELLAQLLDDLKNNPPPVKEPEPLTYSHAESDVLIASASKAELYRFVYALTGLVLGFAALVTGAGLALAGITGHTTSLSRFVGLGEQISDIAPGVILLAIGALVVVVTKLPSKKL